MECNLIVNTISDIDIFSKIAERTDNSFVARLKLVCSRFQELANLYLRKRIVFSFDKITCLFNESIETALHDVAANILITGYQNPFLFTRPSGYIGSSGYIYNLTTGRAKKMLWPCSRKLKFLSFDLSQQIILGNLEPRGFAAWKLDGTVYEMKKEINFDIPCKIMHNWNPLLIKDIKAFNLIKDLLLPKIEIKSDYLITDRKISHLSFIDSKRGWICASFCGGKRYEKIKILNLNDYTTKEKFISPNPCLSVYAKEKGYLIYLNMDLSIIVKDIATGNSISSFNLKKGEEVEKLFYHEESNQVIVISWKRKNDNGRERINVWDIKKEKKTASIQSKKNKDACIQCLNFLADINFLISGDKLGNICFWDLTKGSQVKTIKLENEIQISQMTFNQKTNQIYVTQIDTLPENSSKQSITSRIDLI
jgi:WD40 repeat protein